MSDDEDDTHPMINKPFLFQWRHQARMERMEQQKEEKAKFEQESKEHKKKVQEVAKKLKEMETKVAVSLQCLLLTPIN